MDDPGESRHLLRYCGQKGNSRKVFRSSSYSFEGVIIATSEVAIGKREIEVINGAVFASNHPGQLTGSRVIGGLVESLSKSKI